MKSFHAHGSGSDTSATVADDTVLTRPLKRHEFLRLAAATGAGAALTPAVLGNLASVQAASNLSFSLATTTVDGQGINALVPSYQKLYPNADVSTTLSNNYSTLIRLRLTSGTAPDIFEVGPGYSTTVGVQVLGPAGYLADLSAEPWVKQIPAEFRPVTDYKKKTMFLPTGLGFMAIFYNKKVFSKVGITPPTTQSEFMAACAKIKKAGYVPFALGDVGGAGSLFMTYAMAASCAYATQPTLVSDLDSGKTTFATSGWRTMLEQVQELNQNHYFNTSPEGTQMAAAITMLATGKAAMMAPISNQWYSLVAAAGGNGDIFGTFPYPGDEVPAHAWVAAGLSYGYGISAHSPNIVAAKTFLRYVAQAANLATFDLAAGELPYRTDVHVTEPQAIATALKIVAEGRAATYYDQLWQSGTVQSKLVQGTQNLIAGSGTVDEALQAMDKAFALK